MFLEELTAKVIGAAIEVHRNLGPGLLESIYEKALAIELEARGIQADRQKQLPLRYKGHQLPGALQLDFLVEDIVVLELKAVETVLEIHQAQLLTYLRLANKPLGLLINFNVPILKQGIRRFLNKPFADDAQTSPTIETAVSSNTLLRASPCSPRLRGEKASSRHLP